MSKAIKIEETPISKKAEETPTTKKLSNKVCILKLSVAGFSFVGGVYEDQESALASLKKSGVKGDFVFLPVVTL